MRKEHTFVAMTEQTDGEINTHLLFVSISIIVWLIYNHLTNQIEEKTSYNQNYSGSCKPRAYRVFEGVYIIVLICVVTKYFEDKDKNS